VNTAPKPIPLEDALARLLADVGPLPTQTLPAEEALGRYLASDLRARRTQPASDLSAMDGYAVHLNNLAGPWNVVGESAAGHPFAGSFALAETIRISTGAHMPAGEMAVLLQENVTRIGDRIALKGGGDPTPLHIRKAGYDFTDGQVVLGRGTAIGPTQLALALGSGNARLSVHALPSLAVIDSGDELAADAATCADHQIPATNGAMLAAMTRSMVRSVMRLGPVADTLDALLAALDDAADCDVIVTTGGASVGDHDLVLPALERWGATIDFWRVAIKPGKPLMIGRKGNTVILGLPGNPGSAFVTAFLFLLPLLRRLGGSTRPYPSAVPIPAADVIEPGHARREFLRAIYADGAVTPLGEQDSGGLLSLARANALIDRPAHADRTKAGTSVPVYLL